MPSYVYLITNNLSGKRYVGKTNNLKQRWKHHRCSRLSYIGRAIRKYGVANFTFQLLEECVSEEDAYTRERYWVAFYKSDQQGSGYNLESGGLGGKTASETTRQKQSEARKGKPRPAHVVAAMHTPEARAKSLAARRGKHRSAVTRAKMSVAAKGKQKSREAVEKSAAGHRGRPLSPEHREKIAKACRGKVVPLETRAKMSAAGRGKIKGPLSLEHRLKLSRATKGRPHTPEHRAKLAAANRSRGGLTLEVVTTIRQQAQQGTRQAELAKVFGLSLQRIGSIVHRKVYKEW